MSLEKLAQDAYTQGLTETLRNMNVSDQVKIAAYKHALELDTKDLLAAGGLATAAYGAKKLKDHMDNVKQQNRINHSLVGAGVGGVLFQPDSFKNMKGVRNMLLGAGVGGLGTYLLDDGSPVLGIDY